MATAKITRLGGFLTVAGLPAISSLLLTYILVRGLGVQGFAAWSIVEPVLRIVATIATLGLQYGVLFAAAGLKINPRHSLAVALAIVVPASALAGLLMWLALLPFVDGVGLPQLLLALIAESVALVLVSSMRGQRLMAAWVMMELIRSLGMVVAAFAIWRLAPDWLDSISDFLLLRGAFTFVGFLVALQRVGIEPAFEPALAKRMAAYGLPIVSAGVIQMIATSADRFLLAGLGAPAVAIAVYAAHQRLTGILNVVAVTPINLWYPVEAIRRDAIKDANFFRGVVLGVQALLAFMMLAAFIVGPLLWPIMFPTIGFDPWIYAALCFSVVPQILCVITNIGGLRERSTHINTVMVVVSATVLLGTGVPLILAYAGIGAAIARLAGITAQAVVGAIMSYKIVPLKYPIPPMIPFLSAMAMAVPILFQPLGSVGFWFCSTLSITFIASGCLISHQILGSPFGFSKTMPKI